MTWRRDGALFRDDAFPFENLVTTRELGNMRDPAIREAFVQSLGIDPGSLVIAEQVHGNSIAVVTTGGRQIAAVDGLMTAEKGLSLAIFTADCVPIFFGAAAPHAVALVHAGWRGLAHGIIPETVKTFKTEFGVEAHGLVVSLGPHIRKCCYAVGKDLADVFGLAAGETHLDLSAVAVRQLEQTGVTRIQADTHCTAHEANTFFSYRREKTTGRIMSLVRI